MDQSENIIRTVQWPSVPEINYRPNTKKYIHTKTFMNSWNTSSLFLTIYVLAYLWKYPWYLDSLLTPSERLHCWFSLFRYTLREVWQYVLVLTCGQRITAVVKKLPKGWRSSGPASLLPIDGIETLINEESKRTQETCPPRYLWQRSLFTCSGALINTKSTFW